MENISPKFIVDLVSQIEGELRKYRIYREYDNTEVEDESKIIHYFKRWNITICTDFLNGNFDLMETLYQLDDETLLKIAVDLGIETPDFIPSIPVFRNEIKTNYKAASVAFESALKKIESEPNVAISLVNSVLESIIKEILKDKRIHTQIKEKNKSLYKLAQQILKVFKIYPDENMPEEIKTIGSSLLSFCQGIEDIRSKKTFAHGKTETDYFIEDSMYAYFVVNSVATIGLFLKSYYAKLFPKIEKVL